jgi:predicted ABC-type ATPase
MAINRVEHRVRAGGHHVPEWDIRRRFAAGLHNFFALYQPLASEWWLYNAAILPPTRIAWSKSGALRVVNDLLYNEIKGEA